MAILKEAQLKQYEAEGYTLARQALGEDDLTPMRRVLEGIVDSTAKRLLRDGAIQTAREELPFAKRWPAISQEAGGSGGPHWEREVFTKELYELATHPAILEALKPILGERIYFNGDFHIRPKLPGSDYFPWHQDSQYYGAPTAAMHIVTVWIPFVDVDETNGCLSLVPGSQKWGLMEGARDEKREMRPKVDPETLGASVLEPMKTGDMMLFHNLTYHRSLPNRSEGARWSVDLRYSPESRDDMSAEEKAGYDYFIPHLRSLGFHGFTASGPNRESWPDLEKRIAAARRD